MKVQTQTANASISIAHIPRTRCCKYDDQIFL